MGADLIQEITVVRDNDNGIFKVNQKLLKPCNGIQIQMVGRLVQKQDIGIAEQSFGKQNLNFYVTIQVLHKRVVVVGIDTKTV